MLATSECHEGYAERSELKESLQLMRVVSKVLAAGHLRQHLISRRKGNDLLLLKRIPCVLLTPLILL